MAFFAEFGSAMLNALLFCLYWIVAHLWIWQGVWENIDRACP